MTRMLMAQARGRVDDLFRARDGVREQQHSLRPWTGERCPSAPALDRPDGHGRLAVQDWLGWRTLPKPDGWQITLLGSTAPPARGTAWDGWLVLTASDGRSAGLQAFLTPHEQQEPEQPDWTAARVQVPAIAWSNPVLEDERTRPDMADRSWERMQTLCAAMHHPARWWAARDVPADLADAEQELLAWASARAAGTFVPRWQQVGATPATAGACSRAHRRAWCYVACHSVHEQEPVWFPLEGQSSLPADWKRHHCAAHRLLPWCVTGSPCTEGF